LEAELSDHHRAETRCSLKENPFDGFDNAKEKILRARQKAPTNPEKWKEIYRLLFPDEAVPSPCTGNPSPPLDLGLGNGTQVLGKRRKDVWFLYIQKKRSRAVIHTNNPSLIDYDEDEDQGGNSSAGLGSGKHTSKDIVEYESYLRQKITSVVRHELEVLLEGELNCVGTTLKDKGFELSQKIIQNLSFERFRSWADCSGSDGEASSSSSSRRSSDARARAASPRVAPASTSYTEPSTLEVSSTTPVGQTDLSGPDFEHQPGHYSDNPALLDFVGPEDYILDALDGPGEELLEELLQPREPYPDDSWPDQFAVSGYGLDVAAI
jgi:hypothetical protein